MDPLAPAHEDRVLCFYGLSAKSLLTHKKSHNFEIKALDSSKSTNLTTSTLQRKARPQKGRTHNL